MYYNIYAVPCLGLQLFRDYIYITNWFIFNLALNELGVEEEK